MFEIGNNLREARLGRRVDLVEAEQDTKIRSKYLAALETEDFDVLPGPVYARGFLRTYARYLGLDAQLYIDEYNSRFGRFEDADEPVLGRRPDRSITGRSRVSLRTVLLLSLIALAVVAWLGLRQSNEQPVPRTAGTGAAGSTSWAERHEQDSATPATTAGSARPATPAASAAPTMASLTVRAAGGSSWIEMRRGSRTGPVVWSGIVADGGVHRARAQRIFVTADAPSVVRLRLGGGKVARGTGTATTSWVVTPTAIRPA